MAERKEVTRAPAHADRDPFALLRQMATELDRAFDQPFWSSFRFPAMTAMEGAHVAPWAPKVDVFEKDNRFVTRVDLPGVKREDVTVEVTDGHLALSGTKTEEKEVKKENVMVPLPEGAAFEDIKATFADGVLEVSVPLPVRGQPAVRKVEIQEPAKGVKTAA